MYEYILAALFVAYSPNVPVTEVICLADNVYHEAKGESFKGKLAVAHVTHNRMVSPKYPDTYCDVVKDRKQFSWYWDGKSDHIELKNKIDRKAWYDSVTASLEVINRYVSDITDGSTHYYAHNTVTPYWAPSKIVVTVIDNHTFMK